MSARLKVLAGTAAALVLAWAAAVRTADTLVRDQPLRGLSAAEVSRVELRRGAEAPVVLEARDGAWLLTEPLADEAEGGAVRELVSALSDMTLGSKVSREPASYPDYDLHEASATRVRLHGAAGAAPLLDAYFGRPAFGGDSLYFRRAGEKPVQLASGLSRHMLERGADSWREHALSPIGQDAAETVSLTARGRTYRLQRSSAGWSSDALAPQAVETAVALLFNLRAAAFAPDAERATGLDAPALKAEVATPLRKATLRVGRARPAKKGSAPAYRYARTDGRRAVLLVPSYDADALLDLLK